MRSQQTQLGEETIIANQYYDSPAADSLTDALELNFLRFKTGKISQPAESWNIRTMAIGKPDDVLLELAQLWFFGLEYSPNVPPPSMWYKCFWKDFAFDRQTQQWRLHLGFSD